MTTDDFVADRKRALRARMRATTRVIAHDADTRARRSAQICEQLADVVASLSEPTGAVMAYHSLAAEVDLAGFVAWCDARSIALFAPIVVGDRLEPVPFGLGASATATDAVPVESLDLVVVPGLAFDEQRHRLGRGGGHFDRFLPRLRPGCAKFAVAFSEQIVDGLPLEPHDIPVDLVLTA